MEHSRLAGAAALVVAVAIGGTGAPTGAAGWTVLALLDGRGEMSKGAERGARLLLEGGSALPVGVELIREGEEGEGVVVVQSWWQRGAGVHSHGGSKPRAGLGEAVAALVREGLTSAGTHRVMLALRGHGTPPTTDGAGEGVHRLLQAGMKPGLSPRELGAAIREGLVGSGRRKVDVVVLEACFSASLEVLAELSEVAEHVVCVEGECPAAGLAWERILAQTRQWLDGTSSEQVAKGLVTAHGGQLGEAESSGLPWGVTACRTAGWGAVESALGEVSRAGAVCPAAVAQAAQAARDRGAVKGMRHLVDAGEFAGALAECADSPELATAARKLCAALRGVVVGRWATGWREEAAGASAGIALFLPPGPVGSVQDYVAGNAFAARSGYGELLTAYFRCWAGLGVGLKG